jgi:hypothetical protein
LFAPVSVIIAAASKWTPIGVIIDAVLLPVSTYCCRSEIGLGSPVEHVYVMPPLLELLPPLLDELPPLLLPDPLPLPLPEPPLLEEPPLLGPPLDDEPFCAAPLLLPPELLPFSGPGPALQEPLGPLLQAAVRETTNGTTQTPFAIVHSLRRIVLQTELSVGSPGSSLRRSSRFVERLRKILASRRIPLCGLPRAASRRDARA